MTIIPAEWSDILTVLHETFRIWSPGLNASRYHEYIWEQSHHPWALKHYKFFVLKQNDKVVCSCKLYTVDLTSRGRRYRFGGIGAIYTMMEHRNQGWATELIQQVIELCTNRDWDGVILFSDIGQEFYSQMGFIELGGADFSIFIKAKTAREQFEPHVPSPISKKSIHEIVRIHNNWARKQPYIFERTELYFEYKLTRESFLADHSYLSWPRLEVTFDDEDLERPEGYAITERGGNTLRILEVVGTESARTKVWQQLFERVGSESIKRVRGWESVASDFAPNFKVENELTPDLLNSLKISPMEYYERDWGQPMFLPFRRELEIWADFFPCPLLELDHL